MGALNKITASFAILLVSVSFFFVSDASASSNEKKSIQMMESVAQEIGIPVVTEQVNSENALIAIKTSNGLSTLSRFISEAIKYVPILAMIAITWGGVTYITAYGDEKKVGKAKNIIIYSLLSVILAISAYAIVDMINNLNIG